MIFLLAATALVVLYNHLNYMKVLENVITLEQVIIIKGLGQWAYTSYAANWTNISDSGSSEVDLSGGNGTGFRVLVN